MKFNGLLLIGSLVLTVSSCNVNDSKNSAKENRYMVDLLAEKVSRVNPLELTFYFNERRAKVLDSLRQTVKPRFEQYISYSYWYFRETLNSGDTEKTIQLIDNFYDEIKQGDQQLTGQWNYFLQRLLAVSYIRLGEQVNCLTNHTAESCILPVQGNGVHLDGNGSQRAITIIENTLKDYPEDLELVWLLNICYQTLGNYPDSVPKEFLIPESAFQNLGINSIEKFEDFAPHLGIATKGLSGGSIMEDFNNDGYLDIVTTSSGMKSTDQMRLFINNGVGQFTDQTINAGLSGLIGGLNCVQTDYNNDGLVDIFVLRGGWFDKWGKYPNSLFRNNGNGTFTDVTKEAGLLSFKPTQTAAWADFNNDGWLDVYIGNESSAPKGKERQFASRVHESEFYINQKDGTFKNVAAEKKLNLKEMIKGVIAFDANNDNLMDLYISVNSGMNRLFINKGDLNFEDATITSGVAEPIISFPVGAFDYNNDGLQDLIVIGYGSTSNFSLSHEVAHEALGNPPLGSLPKLFRNNGDNTFTDVTAEAKLNHTIYGMGFNYGDLDNDGWLDLYIGTGDPNFESIIPNRMFKNVEGKYFEEVTYAGGFSNIQKGHGISWGDIDNDGDEDIYITMGGAHEGDIYQNQLLINPLKKGNWVNLKLIGTRSNKAAIGAKLHLVTSNGQHIYRSISSGASFGANSLAAEIGIGSAESITSLEITWPNGEIQNFINIQANQRIEITESQKDYKLINLKRIEFDNSPKTMNMENHE